MSGFEIAGLILGITGPLQQCIQIANYIKNCRQAYKSNPTLIDDILQSFTAHQDKLTFLQIQLDQHNSYIPNKNQNFIQETLTKIQQMIKSTAKDLNYIKDSTTWKIKLFFKAESISTKCHNIKNRLEKSYEKLQRINDLMIIISTQKRTTSGQTNQLEKNANNRHDEVISQLNRVQVGSSSNCPPIDLYKPKTQFFSYSYAAKINFNEKNNDGTFASLEGEIKHELLNPSHPRQNVMAIRGIAGVGKTTTLGMLTQIDEIRDYFIDGVYCMKLGADANNKTVMEEIIKIVKACGGRQLSEEMNQMDTIYEVTEKACEWFKDKQVLFAVDDIWYKDGSGVQIVRELSKLVQSGNNAAMVFTTRDPSVAMKGSAFKLSRRDVMSSESRSILMGHAQCEDSAEFDRETENAIQYLLKICNGLPAAHGVVGKAVGEYALSCTSEFSQAWKWYQQTHGSIVESSGDEYRNLSSAFMTALKILDEEDKLNKVKNETDCYSYYEMHRGLCVLEKQQRAPLSMLGYMWGIEGEDDLSNMIRVREICQRFTRVGLAEWNPTSRSAIHNNHTNNNNNNDKSSDIMECISIHDLLHDFALNEANKKGETEEWHDRVLNGYKRKYNIKMNENAKCEEWWNIENINEDKDGYLLKHLCRHMKSIKNRRTEIVNLVTRPEWIAAQVCTNGILQYGEDMVYATECIDNNTEEIDIRRDDKLSIADMEWIHEAVRLSTAYILRNRREIVFQLYDRLMRKASESTPLNRYLQYMQNNAPEAWIRPLLPCLSGVGSNSISIGKIIECMVVLKGEEEVACGCDDGDIVIVNIKNKYIKRSWNAHGEEILDMKLSEYGKYLISGSWDRTAKVWDVETFELKRVLEGHTGWVNAVWIGNGGNTAFTKSDDGTVRKWNVDTGEQMGEYCNDGKGIYHLAVLEDGKVIIFAGCNGKEIYRVRMGSEEDTRNNGSPSTRIFSKSTEKKVKMEDGIKAFATSKDKTKLAIATGGNRIIIFNTTTVKEIQTIHLSDFNNGPDYIAWSNDGTRLACASGQGKISIIDVNSGEVICEPLKTDFNIKRLELIDDGNKVVFCSSNRVIKWWKVGDISSQASTSDQNRLNCCSFAITPDGSHFVTGHDDGILRIWDATTASLKQSEQICDSTIWAVTVSPDGTRIFCGCFDGTVQVVDKNSLRRTTSFKGHNDGIGCIDISVDGNHLVTGNLDKTIAIWDEKCDGSHSTINTGSYVYQVFICEDGKRIVCVIFDLNYKIQVWDIQKKQCIREKEIYGKPKSRNEAMILIDEMEQDKTANSKTVFCDLIGKEIKYGLFDNYEVLATLEFNIWKVEYDMRHQLLCVLDSTKKVWFFKIEGDLENKTVCTNSIENPSTNASSNASFIQFAKHYNFRQMSSS